MRTKVYFDSKPSILPSIEADEGIMHICAFSETWLSWVLGAVELLKEAYWEDDSGTPVDARPHIDHLSNQIMKSVEVSQMLVGTIIPVYTRVNITDSLYLPMSGASYLKSDYPELWEVMPDAYRWATGFFLSDFDDTFLRGSTLSGVGFSQGSNTVTLTETNMPPHSHPLIPSSETHRVLQWRSDFTQMEPQINGLTSGQLGVWSPSQETGSAGGGQPFDIVPFARNVIYYIRARSVKP